MSEHTKGKWEVAELAEFNGLFMVKVVCPNRNTVVSLTIPTWVGKEEILANAKLIAAAPETAKQRDDLVYLLKKVMLIKDLWLPKPSDVAENMDEIKALWIMKDLLEKAIAETEKD